MLRSLRLIAFVLILLGRSETANAAGTDLPNLGDHALVFDPSMAPAWIQQRVDTIFRSQEKAEFGMGRYALLFKPGIYHLNLRVGFYTQVLGLGTSPYDVTIIGHVSCDAQWAHGNATVNFWRGVENIQIVPEGGVEKWAVSQACPLRRVHVKGDLALDDHGWSSGGFIADSVIEGKVHSGHQQQWLTRASRIGGWDGFNWNMVFVGVDGSPSETFPQPPYVTVGNAPRLVEKPFLTIESHGTPGLLVPAIQREVRGVDWVRENQNARFLPIETFYVANPEKDSAATVNAALHEGKNVLFTPGIYQFRDPLRIERANTVVLGLGFATLEPTQGTAVIEVADVAGVRLAGLLLSAGEKRSPSLLHVESGARKDRHGENPTTLSDLFFRVGGAGIGQVDTALRIDQADVIGDDLWIWRADHGAGVGWDKNLAAHGLVVNGPGVTLYGLAVEHFQQVQSDWSGEDGQVYFYQSEEPYDVPVQQEWSMSKDAFGFPSYRVDASVQRHEAWGLGVYCFFHRNPSIRLTSAISAPKVPGVRFHDVTTISLGGGVGEIQHLVNDSGDAVKPKQIRATLVAYPPR